MSEDRPKKFYKYEGLSQRTLANLKNQVLFFQDVRNFNDPFEEFIGNGFSNPDLLTSEQHKDLKEYFIRELYDEEDMDGAVEGIKRDGIIKYLQETIQDTGHFIRDFLFKEEFEGHLAKNNVTCFSEKNESILMWSHYADDHKGICLEFDSSDGFFTDAGKVIYQEDRPLMNMHDFFCRSSCKEVMTTKYKSWNYEEEWRLFNQKSEVKKYPRGALTGIYFGAKVDKALREIVCLIMLGQNPDVKLHQGKLSKTRYEVKFSEFSYTTHVDNMNILGECLVKGIDWFQELMVGVSNHQKTIQH